MNSKIEIYDNYYILNTIKKKEVITKNKLKMRRLRSSLQELNV